MFDALRDTLSLSSASTKPFHGSRSRRKRWQRKLKKTNDHWQHFLDTVLGQGTYSICSVDPSVSILVLQGEEETNTALQPLFDAKPSFVAFDLEYTSRPAKGGMRRAEVDLIQIAYGSRVFLVHLAAFGMSHTTMPTNLLNILTSPDIRKVANNIRGDAARLFASHSISLHNCADLSYVAQHVDPLRWPLTLSATQRLRTPRYWVRAPKYVADNTRGLERLTFAYTRRVLVKDSAQEDWRVLTERMLQYAADDVHATLMVYAALMHAPSFSKIVFHRYSFDMLDGKPYHIGVVPRKAWRADNSME